MSDPFYSSKYSITRAKHHISDFERQIVEFDNTNPYIFIIDTDADTSEQIHKVKLVKPMPDALPAIASDTVHNLRSALDQTIYALKLISGNTANESTLFPFADNAANFQNTVKGRCKQLPKEIVALICAFQPYKGGNNLLWALNKLSNTNKHAIVRPVILTTGNINITGGVITGGLIFNSRVWDRTKNEIEVFRQPKGGTLSSNVNVTVHIAMCDVEFVDGKPAIAVLNALVRIVESIVLALEAESRRIGLL